MADETEIDVDALKKRMDGALSALRTEFASLRTGRASASMLDPVTVEAYGSPTPINQLGTITVPEPRMVLINVWDKSLVNAVDKAIRNSGLGINPQMDGTILRLPIPELNEERRRDLTKVAGQYAEHSSPWIVRHGKAAPARPRVRARSFAWPRMLCRQRRASAAACGAM